MGTRHRGGRPSKTSFLFCSQPPRARPGREHFRFDAHYREKTYRYRIANVPGFGASGQPLGGRSEGQAISTSGVKRLPAVSGASTGR